MRALLLAGRPDAAARWFNILTTNPAAVADVANQLQLILAFAAPAQADSLTTLALLRGLALTANPPPPAPPDPPPLGRPTRLRPIRRCPPEPPPPLLPPPPPPSKRSLRARRSFSVSTTRLTRALPMEAQESVEPLVSQQTSAGRRPPQALMQRIDRASLSGARGEVALGVLAALGTQGARDLAPDVVVRLVRALQTAGIRDGARELALEALLLRPVTSLGTGAQALPAAPISGGG